MSSPLPANAKILQDHDSETSSDLPNVSSDRASSLARLSSSPMAPAHALYSSSPARSTLSHRSYGSHKCPDPILDRASSSSHSGGSIGGGDMPEGQVAKAVKRHLVNTSSHLSSLPESALSGTKHQDHGTTTSSLRQSTPSTTAAAVEEEEEEEEDGDGDNHITSVHQLPGGSITHGIYKWTENVENSRSQRKRTRSVDLPRHEPSDPSLVHLRDPGGFRRHFVTGRAKAAGRQPVPWMTTSFVEFLALYGHFGGEDLSEEEDEEEDLEEGVWDERRPLLAGQRRRTSARQLQDQVQGTATPAKAVFLLLKSFVGTGVMFLPKAFSNGGLIFSSAVLSVIAAISLYSFLLLVETRNKVPKSFGDIGGELFGPTMRGSVLFAITFSQVGFVCAYMVFVAQNMQALVESVFKCEVSVPLRYLILGQVVLFVPLAIIRKIQRLSVFALVADLFILVGLLYLYYYDFLVLSTQGVGNIIWTINPASFPLFIGTAVFTFEGVGLIIPITESMKDPRKFPAALCGTMAFVTAVFLSVGFISYLAFGEDVQTVILLNLPPGGVVDTIQGLYALAICLSIPLQLFPAVRIVETGLFKRSGKNNPVVKWQKNGFRLGMVLLCAGAAVAGSSDLDKFVSLIGSVCCIPLCFLFPPIFHLKGVAATFRQKLVDVAIIVFGIVSMTYTTYITASLWSSTDTTPPASRCVPHGN